MNLEREQSRIETTCRFRTAKRAMGYLAYDKQRDRIVLFGGRLGWPNDTNDTWEWNGKEWKELK